MRFLFLLLISSSLFISFTAAQSGGVCASPYTNVNGSCFWIQTSPSLFTTAEASCEQNNGHLISIHNAQVNSYVASKATQNGILYWLGLTCLSASTCYWTDGSPLNYTNWETGNPLLDLGNCAYILASGRWVSAGCDNTYYGAFCLSNALPVVPTPSTPAPNYCPANPFYSDSGFVYSPSYPSNYPGNLRCEYLITQQDIYINRLFFTSFVVGQGLDYLQVYDGPSTASPLLGTFTGNQTGQELYSTSSSVTLFFRSTTSYQYPGFSIFYDSLFAQGGNNTQKPTAPPLTDPPRNATTSSPPATSACWNQVAADSAGGYIVSPGFDFGRPQDSSYEDEFNCSTLLTTKSGSYLNLRVEALDTFENIDLLTIYNGPSTNSSILLRVSGDLPLNNTAQSTSNQVLVQFNTDQFKKSKKSKEFGNSGWTVRFWTTYSGSYSGCPSGWTRDPSDSRCYRFLYSYNTTFAIYNAQCTQGFGGQLASVHNDAQRDFIYSFLQSQMSNNELLYTAIGLTPVNSTFVWTDNTPYNYNSFASAGTSSSCYAIQSWISGTASARPIFQNKGWVPINCYSSNAYAALCYRPSS